MRSAPDHKHPTNPSETRCAIYTRKSSEEGLEQEFNSLHAQREACEAYILSQRHEGWRALPTLYDDGGISGGTMDRPALARLLNDIRAKRLDLIVIYKVDRLTRSLADFAKLVDVFNASAVSFVSVTQQFNTATSMGRLTLNMLLSFAQFEREVTGERIRDKIAASKRKGMWMGGHPPLGFDVHVRKLVINPDEASQVRDIFRLYLELGSVRLLHDRLIEIGVTTKRRLKLNGEPGGGKALLRGNLYSMLHNRLYRGEIAHKGKAYPGEHQAIIDQDLWDRVQAALSERRFERAARSSTEHASLLAGIIFDAAGNRLSPTHTTRGSKRYRYYISQKLVTDTAPATPAGQRMPAGDLEALVTGALRDFIACPMRLLETLGSGLNDAPKQQQLLSAAARLAADWDQLEPKRVRHILRTAIARVDVQLDCLTIAVSTGRLQAIILGNYDPQQGLVDVKAKPLLHIISVPVSLRRTGQEMRLIVAGRSGIPEADPALVKLIRQALRFRDQLFAAQDVGIADLARQVGISGSHYTRVLRLGFLATDVVEAIVAGRHPVGFTATKLLHDTRLPLEWAEQRIKLGFPAQG